MVQKCYSGVSDDANEPAPLVHSVSHGWSLIGHYCVTIKMTEDARAVTLVCKDRQQAAAIAAALTEQPERAALRDVALAYLELTATTPEGRS